MKVNPRKKTALGVDKKPERLRAKEKFSPRKVARTAFKNQETRGRKIKVNKNDKEKSKGVLAQIHPENGDQAPKTHADSSQDEDLVGCQPHRPKNAPKAKEGEKEQKESRSLNLKTRKKKHTKWRRGPEAEHTKRKKGFLGQRKSVFRVHPVSTVHQSVGKRDCL